MVAISPDGRTIVWVGVSPEGRQLYARALGEFRARLIPGTEDAAYPFFSPDGRWIGFSAKGEMRKISLDGGPFVTITPGTYTGASWHSDNTIVFGPDGRSGLSRVSADGGVPEVVTHADTARGETNHGVPFVLPDGTAALMTVWSARVGEAQVAVVDLESAAVRYLVEGTNAHYAETGHLVYVATDGTVRAAPFDLDRLEVTGRSAPILEGVNVRLLRTAVLPGAVAELALSRNGTLVYLSGDDRGRSLVLVNRGGGEQLLAEELRSYNAPRFSPDGRSIAVRIADTDGFNIWRYDMAQRRFSKLTSGGGGFYPEWTPDGGRISYIWNPAGDADLVWKRADGSGAEERLLDDPQAQWGMSWAPDGQSLVYRQNTRETGRDIWTLPLTGDGQPTPLVQTPAEERAPRISPDGRFLAFVSDETGRSEIYVRTFPGGDSRWQVTTTGGTEPLWSRRGEELFYRSENEIVSVSVQADSTFTFGNPEAVVDGPYVPNPMHTNYDVHPDGNQFVMVRSGEGETRMMVVVNWFEALRASGEDPAR
jgi:serine/threonine-protein kinase